MLVRLNGVIIVAASTGKIVSSPDHGNHCDFQQISKTLPLPWKCPKGWKYHGNLLEVAMISMIWRGHDFSSDRYLIVFFILMTEKVFIKRKVRQIESTSKLTISLLFGFYNHFTAWFFVANDDVRQALPISDR